MANVRDFSMWLRRIADIADGMTTEQLEALAPPTISAPDWGPKPGKLADDLTGVANDPRGSACSAPPTPPAPDAVVEAAWREFAGFTSHPALLNVKDHFVRVVTAARAQDAETIRQLRAELLIRKGEAVQDAERIAKMTKLLDDDVDTIHRQDEENDAFRARIAAQDAALAAAARPTGGA